MGCSITGQSTRDYQSPLYQTKGKQDKIEVLYHATSKEMAATVVFSAGRLVDMEGRGALFCRTLERAKEVGGSADAIFKAYVSVGVSLVATEDIHPSNLYDLKTTSHVDSLLIGSETGDYLVFSWTQVCLISVHVRGVPYFEIDKEPKFTHHCHNSRCLFTAKSHYGWCWLLCDNQKCLYFDKYHIGECALPCINRDCKRYGRCHIGSCSEDKGGDALFGTNLVGLLMSPGNQTSGNNPTSQALNSIVNLF